MRIFIDPGHGGRDPGAVANGILEKDINLTVALKVKEMLEMAGIEVAMSRYTDTEIDLNNRVTLANVWNADYFISIHHNAGGGIGYDLIHSINNGKGKDLAEAIGLEFDKIQVKHGIYSRAGQNGDYYGVIRDTAMPAVITEFAFLDNPEDVQKVNSDEKLGVEANAIYKGVCNYLGIVLPEPVNETPAEDWQAKYNDLVNSYYSFKREIQDVLNKYL